MKSTLSRRGFLESSLFAGASPLVADAHGVTALEQASSRGNKRLLDALQQAAAKH